MTEIKISTQKGKLDLRFIHSFITESYWGKGRSLEQVKKCVDNSVNFGVYIDDIQIGYARVVTDFTIFAYLLDVFIVETKRGKGYSKILLTEIFNHPELVNIQSWKLKTSDANGLYEKFGFKVTNPNTKIMEK